MWRVLVKLNLTRCLKQFSIEPINQIMLKRIINDAYFYFLIAISITFIFIKIPHLSLPFYWDEAFGHSVAARYLYDHGLGILPGSIPSDISKGHPLLFFFCEALWMKIFGTSIVAMKSYPLFLSVLLIFSIYFFCRKFFNRITGIVACVLFASQEIFLAQSSFVLFEVQLALLTLISLYFFFSKRWILYALSASMLVLTKESGIILVVTLLVWQLIEYIFTKDKKTIAHCSLFIVLCSLFLPLLLVSVFFIIQKFTYGWYFYPVHINFLTFNLYSIFSKMIHGSFAYLFIYYGRNIMTLFLIISIVFVFIKHIKIPLVQKNVIYLFSVFIVLFIIFSSLNFYSTRYILCIFPLYIILSSYLIIKAFNKYNLLLILLLVTILSVKIYYSYTKHNAFDSNLGFADAVHIHKNIVSFCEKEHLQDKVIYTHFLMMVDLTDPYAGYLSDKNKIFRRVTNNDDNIKTAEYCIFSSVENNPVYEQFKKEYNLKLIYRVQNHNIWTEVYKKP